jgi:hypothetical protein
VREEVKKFVEFVRLKISERIEKLIISAIKLLNVRIRFESYQKSAKFQTNFNIQVGKSDQK